MSLPPHPTPAPASKSSCVALDACDTEWFNREVYPHDGRLKAYLRVSFPSVRDVDDLVQQSYVQIWRRQMLRPLASARSFLYTVARNLAIDAVRREARSPLLPVANMAGLEVLDGRPNAVDVACSKEELEMLMAAIESLPKRCREVVILRKLYGMSPPDIARKLGITERVVHVHGANGVRHCDEYLRARGAK